MKNRRIHLLVVIVALAAGASVVGFVPRGGPSGSFAQSRTTNKNVPVKPTILTSTTKATEASATAAAASQNEILREELGWTFGGKQQRGWYLYDELIDKTLDTKHAPTTNEFAEAVTKWQKKRGLGSSGMLDQNSWMAMVSQWQGNRLKDRTSATPDQLVTASPSDCYDPSRAVELRQVERATYEAYRKMLAAAIADLKPAHTPSGELAPN